MAAIAETITIRETALGIRRWIVSCSAHPEWRPGAAYHRSGAESAAEGHTFHVHDGIDYEGMPVELARALRESTTPACVGGSRVLRAGGPSAATGGAAS